MVLQKISINNLFKKSSSKAFISETEFCLASKTLPSPYACIKYCNELSQCGVISFNRQTSVCNLFTSAKNDTVNSANTDIFRKKIYM